MSVDVWGLQRLSNLLLHEIYLALYLTQESEESIPGNINDMSVKVI